MNKPSRRQFLQNSAALASAAGALPWLGGLGRMQDAMAQSTATDYRALVCVFLAGGNDAHNTVIPTDAVSWRCYTATRDPAVRAAVSGSTVVANFVPLALPKASLLPINHSNRAGLNTGLTLALHPQLKRIQQHYNQGRAAVVANVGPLIQPTSKIDYYDTTFPLPAKLGSHNDQQSTWQSFAPEGPQAGWGGRIMDALVARNTVSTFSSMGIGAPANWLSGVDVSPYQLGSANVAVMGGSAGSIFGSAALYQAVRAASAQPGSNSTLAADYGQLVQRALAGEAALKQALPVASRTPWGTAGAASQAVDPLLRYTNPVTGVSALNPLAAQLQMVARMISAHANPAVGAQRQVFMVTLGGFDTHSDQLNQHADLLAKLDHAIDYFLTALGSMPEGDMRSKVTTFTASEFGRALVSNGDGTDHGWGGHHFVFGGAVKGGDLYGHYPQFRAFDNEGNFFSDNLLNYGVLLPEISVDQMAYTFGRWMGASEADLLGIAPHIQNFDPGLRDLGFMA
jgi:uncharacterized protein (DUF1501 family)